MARSVALGPFGEAFRRAVSYRRSELSLTAQEVADRTASAHKPLGRSAVSEIERGARRVDVDDLVTLAVALETSPADLLIAAAGDRVPIPQRGLALTHDEMASWLRDGGDVADVQAATGESELEVRRIGAEIEALDAAGRDRDVFIDIVLRKLGDESTTSTDATQLELLLTTETEARRVDLSRREELENRRRALTPRRRQE